MEDDVLLLVDLQVCTRVLVWHGARCMVEVMSKVDGLPGKPNNGSCIIEFQQGFLTCCLREKFLECMDSKYAYS